MIHIPFGTKQMFIPSHAESMFVNEIMTFLPDYSAAVSMYRKVMRALNDYTKGHYLVITCLTKVQRVGLGGNLSNSVFLIHVYGHTFVHLGSIKISPYDQTEMIEKIIHCNDGLVKPICQMPQWLKEVFKTDFMLNEQPCNLPKYIFTRVVEESQQGNETALDVICGDITFTINVTFINQSQYIVMLLSNGLKVTMGINILHDGKLKLVSFSM
jgi:hypothetical protein